MLRVVVEHWPSGDKPFEVLDEVRIYNLAEMETEVADYRVTWDDKARAAGHAFVTRRHVREKGRWALVERVAAEVADIHLSRKRQEK